MQHLHVLVEGQTEEVIARDVLKPHFESPGVWVGYSIYKTKRLASGLTYKGGALRWPKLRREISLLLGDTSTTLLTTMFDYYAFADDAPGMSDRPPGSPYTRVRHVERAMAEAVGSSRFLPHLTLHETETWVLADCVKLGEVMGDASGATELRRVVEQELSPELVDDGPATAPSKRIRDAYPNYRKTIDGPLVVAETGIAAIRSSCPHADEWLGAIEKRLKSLSADSGLR